MCGLLDYVIDSIMSDEGVFAPHYVMVNVSLNGNNLGLYLLEETDNSQGLFAGEQHYDGQIFHESRTWVSPEVPVGVVELETITAEQERSKEFTSSVNKVAFAKCLALLSRFQASHATQGRDFRLYRHPYLDSRSQ